MNTLRVVQSIQGYIVRWSCFIKFFTNTAVHIVNFTSLSELRGSAFINLSVSLQLNGTNPSFPYSINIVPEVLERNISVISVGPIFFELMVRYDTWYNISIMVCGELSYCSAPLIGLYYSKY